PSLMDVATVEDILKNIRKHWSLANDIEITLEANPTSVEAQKFKDFRAAGINRLSLGIQSLQDEALQFLGRKHDANQAKDAIVLAAEHFPRFSFDLIYARHAQTPKAWEEELRGALSLAKAHLSLYQLTIEPNTQFYTLANRGEKLTAPDDQAAAMYEMTQDILSSVGLPAYEISNHAAPGDESRHNLTYWHYNDYIGIGPGAHGRYQIDGKTFATEDHKAPDVWLKKVAEQGHGLRLCDHLNCETTQREALMMGLRLTKGIAYDDWQNKFGTPLSDFLSAEKIKHLKGEGYLANTNTALQATGTGLQRLNAVLNYLMN
ncbi:MAG: radical SAM family heme chaperone HemW, partial [Alphaproteobacteria bacterium]